MTPRRPRTLAAAALAALLVTAFAPSADAEEASPSSSASSSGTPSADPELMTTAHEALAEQDAAIEAAEVTDAMRADSTLDLRAPDSTFDLRPDDSTTVLEKTQEKADDTVVTLTSDLLFDFGKATLTPEAEAAVAALADDVPQDAAVHVDGYTDSVGSDAFNRRLSTKRAHAVADVLAAERPDLTLKVQGHGEADPVADNEVSGDDNPAGRALNRRVEVTYPTA
ncbi:MULTISPECIES: OmpA family protein [unclassified Isoptericola]|uniref:OmpA family protein n=1 Tax=unclassified Isoptericola TaxID=2623355 RepID=UPI0036508418